MGALREIPCPLDCGGTVTVLEHVAVRDADGTPLRWALDSFVCDGCTALQAHDIPNRD